MTAWPKDNQTARNAFYGDPGRGEIAAQMVPVIPPFRMTYSDENGTKVIRSISFHRKCAAALAAALDEIWDYCQHDQTKIDASGASKYFGAYNPRKVRGSATKWSNHAYAAAIDLNANQNALGAIGNMPPFIVDAFCRQGAMWGGWYNTRPDWMHFEFVDNGGRMPKSAPPVYPPIAHLFDDPTAPADEFEGDDEPETPTPPPLPLPNNTNGKGINIQPQNGKYDVDTEILQQKLQRMKYYTDPDGFWGSKTRGAVVSFMTDRGQPTDGSFTPAVSAELNKALAENWSHPIVEARANATAKDIAPKVNTVQQNLWQRFVAKVSTGLATVGLTGATLSSAFETVRDKLEPFRNLLKTIPPEVWFLTMIGVAALVWWLSNRSIDSAVRDYNTGKIN